MGERCGSQPDLITTVVVTCQHPRLEEAADLGGELADDDLGAALFADPDRNHTLCQQSPVAVFTANLQQNLSLRLQHSPARCQPKRCR
jgi:hypothetical protein